MRSSPQYAAYWRTVVRGTFCQILTFLEPTRCFDWLNQNQFCVSVSTIAVWSCVILGLLTVAVKSASPFIDSSSHLFNLNHVRLDVYLLRICTPITCNLLPVKTHLARLSFRFRNPICERIVSPFVLLRVAEIRFPKVKNPNEEIPKIKIHWCLPKNDKNWKF